ncbi:hypothetical protein ACFFSW_34665 [Saccharothrix longispora]|uniref:Uncharacterized protein n=2 Tax=Saccharothrix longispora TaxID=33920 RepID=A0ABU1PLY7_9PSEU|nr:hypothetical protein [Saccharothrix longispora]
MVPLTALLLTTACGAVTAGGHVECTEIGTPVGIRVDVEHPDVTAVEIEVCRDGSCATPAVELRPASRAVESTCTGTGPDDSCSARSEPTGGKYGFADVPGLPTTPVAVTARLLDQSGSVLVEREIRVTPEMAYPNGPDCPAGGPQAGISVGADGSVTER